MRDSAQNNAQNSRLLSLPAEIRNRIYVYVLGGRDVHIHGVHKRNVDSPDFTHSLCTTMVSDGDIMARVKAPGGSVVWATYEHRHLVCHQRHSEGHERLCLSILQTCSQIYIEAALIPFATNTFAVRPLQLLDHLVIRLNPTQSRAIRTISTADTNPFYNLASIKALSGVRELVLFNELDPKLIDISHVRNCLAPTSEPSMCHGHGCPVEWRFAGWLRLQRLTLTSVSVAIYLPGSKYRRGTAWTDERKSCDTISAALEARILSAWDEATYQKRLEAGDIYRAGKAGRGLL